MAKIRMTSSTTNGKTVDAISHEDAWAHTPDHQESVGRALADSAAGRVYRLSEDDLLRLMDEAEQARREEREYRLPREWLKARDAAHSEPAPQR